jgi:hypothetical protein
MHPRGHCSHHVCHAVLCEWFLRRQSRSVASAVVDGRVGPQGMNDLRPKLPAASSVLKPWVAIKALARCPLLSCCIVPAPGEHLLQCTAHHCQLALWLQNIDVQLAWGKASETARWHSARRLLLINPCACVFTKHADCQRPRGYLASHAAVRLTCLSACQLSSAFQNALVTRE